ncbi:MAG: DUF2501 domain-containing protein [Sphingomonas sp.]|jgi:hypothetical protein|nr:MAG: DUF2501 domain-containing protein [Sphingomonas sp.]
MIKPIALAALLALSAGADAQTRSGGLAGLLGGALPNVASASAGNAAGLLGYCVKNNVLSGANAATVLGNLTGKPGVATSDGFAAGQAGTLDTGRGAGLSLDALKGQAKTKVCDLVLKRAKAFL